MKTKRLTLSALLIAIGTAAGHLIYFPVGVAKCYPIQHTINVLSAVILGPWYAVENAFVISLLRNILGVGSPLAFPGSMIGAFIAGILFKRYKRQLYAVLGEIFGTGILGAIVSYPIAKYMLGKEVAVFFFVVPFLVSTIGGSIIGYLILNITEKNKFYEKIKLEK